MRDNLVDRDLSKQALAAYRMAQHQFQRGLYQQSVVSYHLAIDSRADFPEAYCGRGTAYTAMRKFDLALRDAGQAIALKADYALAYYLQGAVNYAIGNLIQARSSLITAATLFFEQGEQSEFNRVSKLAMTVQSQVSAIEDQQRVIGSQQTLEWLSPLALEPSGPINVDAYLQI